MTPSNHFDRPDRTLQENWNSGLKLGLATLERSDLIMELFLEIFNSI